MDCLKLDPSPWVGTLALLRRVAPQHRGRLVLVEYPAPPQPSTRPAANCGPDGLQAWHVYVLGTRLRLDDGSWREAVVAEVCLQPLCRLRQARAKAVIRAQALRDADEAFAELRMHLAAHPMTEKAFESSMERAAIEALGRRNWPAVPVCWN